MTPEVLCAACAAARVKAFLPASHVDERELVPAHPAFLQLRRMVYIWNEPGALQPVGDALPLWLTFLRERGARDCTLVLTESTSAVHVETPGADELWSVTQDEGRMRMDGRSTPAAATTPVDVQRAADALGSASDDALARAGAPAAQSLRRALAILDSDDDGSEVSDVAWPTFVLPAQAYALPARRLMAAACAAWESEADVVVAAATVAVCAAVGSVTAAASG